MSRIEPLADLIVLAPDLPELRLVVEIKLGAFHLPTVLARVKSYMTSNNCPLGLLITPTQTWLLRDTYEAAGAMQETIYPTQVLLGVSSLPEHYDEFESIVARWLENLTSGSSAGLRDEVRQDVARYVLPAVTEGRVESGRYG